MLRQDGTSNCWYNVEPIITGTRLYQQILGQDRTSNCWYNHVHVQAISSITLYQQLLVQPCTINSQYNIGPAIAGTALLVQNCQLLILDYNNNHLSLLGNIWPRFFFIIGLAWHAFSAVADLHVRNIDWQKGAPNFF